MKKLLSLMCAILTLVSVVLPCVKVSATAKKAKAPTKDLYGQTTLPKIIPDYPSDGQQYWIIFNEGLRSNRLEMSTFDASTVNGEVSIVWRGKNGLYATAKGGSVSRCKQYHYTEDAWIYDRTYSRLSDCASAVLASNVNVFDENGNLIIAASTYPKSEDFVLSVFDKDNLCPLENQTLNINGTNYTTNDSGSVDLSLNGTVKVSCSYYDDYMFNTDAVKDNQISIYMKMSLTNTEPSISSIYVKEHNDTEWIDVGMNKLDIAHTPDKKYDVNIYVNWKGFQRSDAAGTVYLCQGNGKALPTVETNSNIASWTDVPLGIFDIGQPIYVYCVGYKKNTSEPEFVTSNAYPTKLNILNNNGNTSLAEHEISLFGKNILKITLDDDIPLLGGSEISLGDLKFPISFNVADDGKIRIAVGFGGAGSSYDSQDEESSTFYKILGVGSKATLSNNSSKTDKDNAWNMYKSNVSAIKSYKNSTEKANALARMANRYKKELKESENSVRTTSIWGTSVKFDVLGYIEGYVTDEGWMFSDVCIQIALNASVTKSWQIVYAPIPIPFYIELGFDCGIKVSVEWSRELAGVVSQTVSDWEFDVAVAPSIAFKLGGYVGIKWLKLGLQGEAKLEDEYRFIDHSENGSFTLAAHLKADAFVFHFDKVFAEKTWTWHSAKSGSGNDKHNMNLNEAFKADNYMSLAPRDYLKKMRFIGTRTKDIIGNAAYTAYTIHENIYEHSDQKLVEIGGKPVLFYIMDNKNRESQNRTMLVYSIYENNAWTAPVPVNDDGTADFMPDVYSDGTNAFIVWQNIASVMPQDVTLADYSAAADIMYAEFDGQSIHNVHKITDNSTYDYCIQQRQ